MQLISSVISVMKLFSFILYNKLSVNQIKHGGSARQKKQVLPVIYKKLPNIIYNKLLLIRTNLLYIVEQFVLTTTISVRRISKVIMHYLVSSQM